MHFHRIVGDTIDEMFGRRMEMQLPGGAVLSFDDVGTAFAEVQLDRMPKVFGHSKGCVKGREYVILPIRHGPICQEVDGRLGLPDTLFRDGVILFFRREMAPAGIAQRHEQ